MAQEILKIDTHQHIFPLQIRNLVEGTPLAQGFQGPEWSLESTLEFMSQNKIGASILSCAIPLTIFKKSAKDTAILAREINEFMAELRDQHPAKLGFFAVLPALQDVSACVEEIRFVMHTLKADGIALFTSYDDKYLGHPDFEGIWAELDCLSAAVFIHPTMEDWAHETTRTAIHLLMTGSLRKFPHCRIILSHGGGTLPYIAGRISEIPIQNKLSGRSPEEFMKDVTRFWFDTALMGDDVGPLKLLLEFAQEGHILYGSDYPFVREPAVARKITTIEDVVDKSGQALPLVTRRNALKLFPRFEALA